MSKLPNDEIEPVTEPVLSDPTQDLEVPSVGVVLRQAREGKDLELRDVALKTRQSQETLASLEAEETDHIPASILRLQARNYARFLGLPEDEIVAAFSQDRGVTNVRSMPAQASETKVPVRSLMIVGGALAVLAIVVGVVTLLASPSDTASEDPLAISARLAPAFDRAAGSAVLSADAGEEFAIRALETAWIEVRGSDGTVFRSRDMRAGETYFPRADAGWTITVRDAAAFQWRLGERSAGPVGDPDQALFSVSVDAAHEAAIKAKNTALAEAEAAANDRR
ncbi:MAG: RodZ domain-containing protein [Pseudomonadota bacterium]